MPSPMASSLTTERIALYGLASFTAAGGVIFRAFRERSNFYAATVWLARSNGCLLILLNFGLFATLGFAKIVQKVFFGQLRAVEIENLYERSWYSLVDTLLAMAIFRDDFDVSFVLLFSTLLFLKAFHWLSSDRVEFMEQSPSVERLFHIRMCTILSTLFLVDMFLVAFVVEVLIVKGSRVGIMILFASEFIILTTSLWSTFAKYLINCHDLRSEEPWEAKSMYIFYVDLANDVLKLATHLSFFILLTSWYGLPLSQIRDLYVTGRSCASKVRDLIRYRAATRNMDSRYPDATAADMAAMSDGTCIICREDMELAGSQPPPQQQNNGLNVTPKRLPCGHIFHFHCLRSWLERQQSCPTCRRTVLEETPPAPTPPAPADQQQPPQAPATDEPQPPAARAFDTRLQDFLQRLQSDAQRVRNEGNSSARRAARSGSATPRRAPASPTSRNYLPNAEQGLWMPPPPESLQLNGRPKKGKAKEPTTPVEESDPEDPREAARAAALKRFTTLNGTSTSTQRLGDPHLIPLFETWRIPAFDSTIAPTLPYPLLNQQVAVEQGTIDLEQLSDEQLRKLSSSSREGLEERLRVLTQVQASVWNVVEQLTRMLSVIPPEGAEEGKGKQPAEGVNAPTQ